MRLSGAAMLRSSKVSGRLSLPMIAAFAIALSLVLLVRAQGWLVPLDLLIHDIGVSWRTDPAPTDAPVVVVGIEETDIERFQWPVEDAVLVDTLERILEGNPAVIGVDILRERPVGSGGPLLDALIRREPRIYWVRAFGLGVEDRIPAPAASTETGRAAFADQFVDRDRVVRRGLLFLDDGIEGGRYDMALGLRLAISFLQQQGVRAGAAEDGSGFFQLGPHVFRPLGANSGGYVDTTAAGYQFLLDYVDPGTGLRTVGLSDLLSGAVDPEIFAGRIVLIGSRAPSLKDLFFTPLSRGRGASFVRFGVDMHALEVAQLLAHGRGERPGVSTSPEWFEVALTMLAALAAAALVLIVRSMRWLVIIGAGGLALAVAFWALAFQHLIWVPAAAPLVAALLSGTLSLSLLYQQESRRRRQEELARVAAEAAAQAKTDFLSTLSHEIRTPLNGVIGMLELLRGRPLDRESVEFVTVAHASSEALLGILNDVLDAAKIEAGKLEIEMVPFDPDGLVDAVASLQAPRAQERGIDLSVFVDPAIPSEALGDPNRIRQVLINLTSNAVKFTERGSIRIRVEPDPTAEARVRFSVIDTGIGLSTAQREKLFQPFAQADTSTTRLYGGTGLGLSICLRLVEAMGGTIGVDSEPGEGSTFHFSLPLPPVDHATAAATPPDVAVLVQAETAQARDDLLRMLPGSRDATTLSERNADTAMVAVVDGPVPEAVTMADRLGGSDQVVVTVAKTDIGLRRHAAAQGLRVLGKPFGRSALWRAIAEAAGQQVDAGPMAQPGSPHGFATGLRCLVIDDNATNRFVAQQQLSQLGLACDLAESGEAAMEMTAAESYHVILVDISMPGMDGFAFARAVRAREHALGASGTPIICMSAHRVSPDDPRFVEAGMSASVPKPTSLEAIQQALVRLLPDAAVASANEPNPTGPRDTPSDDPDQPIDMQALARNLGAAAKMSGQILGMFADAIETDLDGQLSDAAGARDIARTAHVAHAIRGVAANAGAVALSTAAGELEEAAPRDDWTHLDELVSKVRQEADRACRFARAEAEKDSLA